MSEMWICDKDMHCIDCPRNYPDETCEHWIEVAPVKYGRWIKDKRKSKFHIEPVYICSCCREQEAWGVIELSNYCPNCGARMKGEENE